jgi:hypothetical protein
LESQNRTSPAETLAARIRISIRIKEAPVTKRPLDYYLLWCVALVSLLIGAALIVTLGNVRVRALEGIRTATDAVHGLRNSSIDYVVRMDQSLPVSLTVPFSTTIVVPINTTLPINTDFNLTLRTPLGDYPVTVPVQSSVPVNMQTSVPVRLSVPISASVPVALSLPIRINLAQTTLGTSLEQLETYLSSLTADLEAVPFLPAFGR